MAPSRVQEPHNVEAEIVFLGAILLEPQTISRAGQLVRPADFFVERHSLIYQTMLELDRLGLAIDLITLGDRLGSQLEEVGGLPYLTSFLTLTPTAQHLDYYAGLIRKYARLRRLIKGAGRIVRLANLAGDQPDEALALAEKTLLALVKEKRLDSVRPLSELVRGYLERVKAQPESGLGLSTGIAALDELCGRLQPADLVLVAGEPGSLKTALMLKIARSVSYAGRKVALFSLESSAGQVVQRLLGVETGIAAGRLRSGRLESEWPQLEAAGLRLAELNLYLDDTPGLLLAELRSKARWLHYLWQLDLIIVNYLQLLRPDQRLFSREQELAAISRALKALARELNIPLLAVSVLEPLAEGGPGLAQLGPVQYEADIIWLCKKRQGHLWLEQARWRDGPAGGGLELPYDPIKQEFTP